MELFSDFFAKGKLLIDFDSGDSTVLPFSHEEKPPYLALSRDTHYSVMKQIKLTVQARDGKGRSAAKRLRANGQVPAVVYGKHNAPVKIAIEKPEVARLLKETTGETSLVELNRDGNATLSIVQEVQRNPLTEQIIHIDFHEVSTKEEMQTHVAIHFVGEAYGVKNQNGLIDISSYQIDVRCLPKDLPGSITVDVSDLKVGGLIHTKDLPKLDGVTYLADEDHVIVSCLEQRVDSAAEAETEGAAAATGEAPKKAE